MGFFVESMLRATEKHARKCNWKMDSFSVSLPFLLPTRDLDDSTLTPFSQPYAL